MISFLNLVFVSPSPFVLKDPRGWRTLGCQRFAALSADGPEMMRLRNCVGDTVRGLDLGGRFVSVPATGDEASLKTLLTPKVVPPAKMKKRQLRTCLGQIYEDAVQPSRKKKGPAQKTKHQQTK